MKPFLLFFLLLCSLYTRAQSPDELWKSHCLFKTALQKNDAPQVSIAYPCKWQADKKSGKLLKTWTYEPGDEDAIIETAMFTPSAYDPQRVDQLVAKKNPIDAKEGQWLWSRKVQVNGHDCAEIVCKSKKTVLILDMYIYSIQYIIPCKGGELTIGFMISSPSETRARNLFDQYKTLFYNLAGATEFAG